MGIDVTHSDTEQWERQRGLLSAYLDDALELKEHAALQAHLDACADCQHELAALRQTRALVRALPTPALPRSFSLPETVETRRTMIRPVPGWARPMQQLGGIAAMIGVALLCASALPSIHFGFGGSRNSALAPMHSSSQAAGGASSAAASGATTPGQADQVRATPTAPTMYGAGDNATPTPQFTDQKRPYRSAEVQPVQPFPVLPVSGGVLLVGGVGAVVAGGVARRRSRNVR